MHLDTLQSVHNQDVIRTVFRCHLFLHINRTVYYWKVFDHELKDV